MPEPIEEFCTRDVLVMTYIPGRKFIDVVKVRAVDMSEVHFAHDFSQDFYAKVAERQ
jgi:predicted unusual protein kinase regulating ubiquinone biosynthesis (AarF/ABC1/UbiB family)